jgi:16S rRNA G1207 methylase RsmC
MTTTTLDPRELGRLAYRRNEDPFAILDRQLRPALDAIPPGPGSSTARDAVLREWGAGWSAAKDAGEPRTDPPLPQPKPTLQITHTAAEGTMLEGTSKGDGAWEAIKAAQREGRCRGWRYFPSIRSIGVSYSRDHAPKLYLIDEAAQVLRNAGFDVEIEIDGAPRRMEDAEAARADRMDDRADALASKAARRGDEAESRWAAADAISEHIPPGQPILVGHHSERGHRRALARMDGHMRASLAAAEEAKLAAERAETAARHMDARNNPRRVYRRIRTLEAEQRKDQRELTPCRVSGRKLKPAAAGQTLTCPACYRDHAIGDDLLFPEHGAATGRYREQVELRVAHRTEQIRYWREALEAAKAAGADVPPDTDAIEKGDWIRSWAGWTEVTRVNKVTVTVLDTSGYGDRAFPRKITLDDIRQIRKTSPYEPAPAEPVVDLDDQPAPEAPQPVADPVVEAPAEQPAVPARHPSGLSPAAVDALRLAAADEQHVWTATVVLPRPVYAEVDRTLTGIGGRWDPQQRAYTYSRDPRPALEDLTGQPVLPPPSASRDKALSYFRTPDTLADRLVSLLSPHLASHGKTDVLEPSAGDGSLVAAIRRRFPDVWIDAVEPDRGRRARITGANVVHSCGLQEFAIDFPDPMYRAVVMNPPFTEPGDRLAWATHTALAWSLLAPGGELVAILPKSWEYRDDRRVQDLRDQLVGADTYPVPDGAFSWAGTGVHVVLVHAVKPTQQ